MPELSAEPVTVLAPATSANLGPGYDALGLGLGLYDQVWAQMDPAGGLTIQVVGEGADWVARDQRHLVVRSIRAGFAALGAHAGGLRLRCHNAIPHGRGLGSSAAAIVTGLRLAEAMVEGAVFSDDAVLALATELEGHPDNVAACLFGGLTVAWLGADGPGAARLTVHPELRAVVFVPPGAVSTALARRLLPLDVSHADAAANAGRAALMVAALTSDPRHLMAATEDRLHQSYRRAAMPESLRLLDALRAGEVAAVVSGAGPSVMALATSADPVDAARWAPRGWRVLELALGVAGAHVVGEAAHMQADDTA